MVLVNFTLDGHCVCALNGGPNFKFSPAVSFLIKCNNQVELDGFWEKLLEGGSLVECGWLADKYGFSWQVAPAMRLVSLENGTLEVKQRMTEAMMKMVKLDFAELEAARDGLN